MTRSRYNWLPYLTGNVSGYLITRLKNIVVLMLNSAVERPAFLSG
jgi:hypothetical protein